MTNSALYWRKDLTLYQPRMTDSPDIPQIYGPKDL